MGKRSKEGKAGQDREIQGSLNGASKARIENIAVIGLGLIGGSLAMAIQKSGFAHSVTGYDLDHNEMTKAQTSGIIDVSADSAAEAVDGADVVVLATPVKSNRAVLESIKTALPDRAILTDVGSAKGCFIKDVDAVLGCLPLRLVPGHPIAGSEKSGIDAADDMLFDKHNVILTPLEKADAKCVAIIREMWESCGARVLEMAVDHHDEVLAATSHLPHLIAFSLVDTLAGEDDNREIFQYAAGGFRDFTRIAASDPVMWRDISLANRDAILNVLDHFSHDLNQLRHAIEEGDSDHLMGVFTRAKAAREHFSKINSDQAYTTKMTKNNVRFNVAAGGSVNGTIRVAGDKSISHRSIMLGALAQGTTEITGFLEGEDSLATLQAFRDMGVVIEGPEQGKVTVHGVGLHGLKQPPGPLYLGNSGTAMRLFTGLLSGQAFDVELTGDKSLSSRPMNRVAEPLREMGAKIETAENGRPPIKISGGQHLEGIHYDMPIASAQVKSCLLLAGLYADGQTSVTEPAPTRDHTERMLQGFGYPVAKHNATSMLDGDGVLFASNIDVPSDISSAAFFLVAATITPGSELTLEHVGINPTRVGVINILRLMGADIEVKNKHDVGGEPVADLTVRYAPLKGIEIPVDQVPLAIDEFPVLFIAAVCADGRTILKGAEELRVKESDRIQVMADGLSQLGVSTQVTEDGIVIDGAAIKGGEVDSHGDHRIAMAFAVAALRAEEPVIINDCANVATSFPNFVELANSVGMQISVK